MSNTKKKFQKFKPPRSKSKINPKKKTTEYLDFFQKGFVAMRESCPNMTSVEITKTIAAIWKEEKKIRFEERVRK